ncbi:MAG: quinolinate synthase [Syntrophobacterales bacterium RIFOXYC2_FULL_60_23]|nr:MAG: quinolinate synthase [Syntrophobacterales bacterium RIFOXYC2_FULL_60_23]
MQLIEKINKLKKEKNAVILAHNYQIDEVQDIADYVGDSLGLSIQASKTAADVIVFCGVYFMAETAKILSPHKTVLIPDPEAGCPMADMITADQLRALKALHPGAKVLCYVNTTAEVKAECDLACTSSNALTLVREAFSEDEEIIFVPDKYLANHVSTQLGRVFITWKGFCPTHARILPEAIEEQIRLHPGAEVMVHPECRPGVIALADQVLSTGGMCAYARESAGEEFIVGTEVGILHRLRLKNPGKKFYPASELAVCPNMKRTTLEKVLWSLEGMTHEVTVPEEVMVRARGSIEKMLSYR